MTRRRPDSTCWEVVRARFEWGLLCVETGQGRWYDSDIYFTHADIFISKLFLLRNAESRLKRACAANVFQENT